MAKLEKNPYLSNLKVHAVRDWAKDIQKICTLLPLYSRLIDLNGRIHDVNEPQITDYCQDCHWFHSWPMNKWKGLGPAKIDPIWGEQPSWDGSRPLWFCPAPCRIVLLNQPHPPVLPSAPRRLSSSPLFPPPRASLQPTLTTLKSHCFCVSFPNSTVSISTAGACLSPITVPYPSVIGAQ